MQVDEISKVDGLILVWLRLFMISFIKLENLPNMLSF